MLELVFFAIDLFYVSGNLDQFEMLTVKWLNANRTQKWLFFLPAQPLTLSCAGYTHLFYLE